MLCMMRADLNDYDGVGFICSTLLRDQDVELDQDVFSEVFKRAAPFLRRNPADFIKKSISDREYFALQV